MQSLFTLIYKHNAWGNAESRSGPGSSNEQTDKIVHELPRIFRLFNITSLLDIPCGDFRWMKRTNLGEIVYTGADIVPDIISVNRQYENDLRHFQKLDIISDNLPAVDLVLVRDCLVHFSVEHIFMALDNLIRSGSRYLLTTTFNERRENIDILTGQWRPLNLQVKPFSFSPPLELINEECTEFDGSFPDKSLGLWELESIAKNIYDRHEQ